MRTIQSHWTFHKAGQGCFYTGLISAPNGKIFSFVFDCGSTKGAGILREEIENFKDNLRTLGKNEIDLLVLSHYDADHINQLPSLLKDFKCKLVVLPYLSNLQRLYVYSRQRLKDSTDHIDYLRFIRNPSLYLNQLNIERIIFIDGNGESAGNNPISIPRFPIEPINGDFRDANFNSFESIINLPDHTNNKVKGERNNFSAKHLGAKIELRQGNGTISVGSYWEFYFYERDYLMNLDKYRDILNQTFGLKISDDGITDDELSFLVKDRSSRKKLKNIHEKFFGDTNDTGLIVQHGPIGQRHVESYNKKLLYSEEFCFTLLNGDCSLSKLEYPEYIKHTFPYIRFFQVPHHGSLFSWGSTSERLGLGKSHMIVNYGSKNRYGHPHPIVINLITSGFKNSKLKHNTEKKRFIYKLRSYIR